MAATSYNQGSSVIRKYADVANDFPSNGVSMPARTESLLIVNSNAGGGSVELLVTGDTREEIENGTASWVLHATNVGDGMLEIPQSPTGIKLTQNGAAAVTAWIIS